MYTVKKQQQKTS